MKHPLDEATVTFFSPYISLFGGSEHATRFPSVYYGIKDQNGTSAYEIIMSQREPTERISAVELIKAALDVFDAAELQSRECLNLMWQYIFAVKKISDLIPCDIKVVSDAATSLVVRLFEVTRGITDEELLNNKRNILIELEDGRKRNYNDFLNRECYKIPNKRSESALRAVKKVDPSFFKPRSLKILGYF